MWADAPSSRPWLRKPPGPVHKQCVIARVTGGACVHRVEGMGGRAGLAGGH